MTGTQLVGIACIVLSVALLASGIHAVWRGPGLMDPSGLGVSHAVGAFLPAAMALVIGLWFFRKQKPS